MIKQKTTKNAKWQSSWVRFLAWFYLGEFLLRQALANNIIPDQLAVKLLFIREWLRFIGPFGFINDLVSQIFEAILVSLVIRQDFWTNGQWASPQIINAYSAIEFLLIIILQLAFLVGLFKKWRFSWVILLLSYILAIGKSLNINFFGQEMLNYRFISLITSLALTWLLWNLRLQFKATR